jgi:E3 ubiquitin-protein ligase TRIP12
VGGIQQRRSSREARSSGAAAAAVATESKTPAVAGSGSSAPPDDKKKTTTAMDSQQQREVKEEAAAAAAAAEAVAAAMDEEEEGEGEEEVPGSPAALSRDLASASSALHGLLAKLGAGLDDLLPGVGMNQGRLKTLLAGLRAEGEEARQLEALMSLCDLLAIATEESLATFSLDAFVPALVHLLNAEWQPDVMLLAARALTHLADVLPASCAAIVHYGAVPCFCARLLTIEYIDLAEQSLQVNLATHPSFPFCSIERVLECWVQTHAGSPSRASTVFREEALPMSSSKPEFAWRGGGD